MSAHNDGISPKQREVLKLLAVGMSNDEIAASLYLSAETVKTHLKRLFKMWGARTRAHVVHLAYTRGVLVPREPAHLEPLDLKPFLGTCRGCHSAIAWAITGSGHPVPVSMLPTANGGVLLGLDRGHLRAVLLDQAQAAAARRQGTALHRFHVVDCPADATITTRTSPNETQRE